VMMNVIPAQIAKVQSIAVASPPQKDFGGLPHPTILATCALLGITEVYAVGGAQAIALFAYGMEGVCEKADLVTGPGNIYVAAAKRALRGIIGIDSEAGPTEIAVLADSSAIAADVAADLISQAEHDVIAAAVLVTDSLELAAAVEAELKVRVAATKHADRIKSALSGVQSAIALVDDMQQGLDVVNAYAAEHLEIQTRNSRSDADKIRNAGAVFIGRFSPVSLGDYSAGSNHVLPTGGCACHSSGLSVQTFLRGLHFIEYVRPMSPYGAPQVPAVAALNTNENPYSPSPALQKAITDAVAKVAVDLNRYPDRDATIVRTKLATYINEGNGTSFTLDNIWAANGSNEIIQSIFLAFAQGVVLGFTPSYSMHPLIAKTTGAQWIDGKRNADFSLNASDAVSEILKNKPSLTFITTPNNPTGGAVTLAEIQKLADAAKEVGGLLVVDEAYAEFSQEVSAVTLVANNPHVIVIRTMSKAFAFAGARLGYLISDVAVKDAMMIVRLPYHLSALTQAAAQVAIDHRAELLGGVSTLIKARGQVVQALHDMGLTTITSSANFVLFTGFKHDAPQLWAALLEKGVLIRDVGLSGYLRVTIGNEAENKLFVSALKELIINVDTGVPFFDHMMSQLGKHSGFDLTVKTTGDVDVDSHHTVEDTSLAFGQALREALGDKAGIRRFGDSMVPLDEVLVQAAVDLSGRPYLVHRQPEIVELIGTFDTTLGKHIWESIVAEARIALHIRVLEGRNAHHVFEAQFKAVARALRDAVSLDGRVAGIPSTKGSL